MKYLIILLISIQLNSSNTLLANTNTQCSDQLLGGKDKKTVIKCLGEPEKIITVTDDRMLSFEIYFIKIKDAKKNKYKFYSIVFDLKSKLVCSEGVVEKIEKPKPNDYQCYDCTGQNGLELCN